ncbi:Antiviral helicase ski2 [Coemansia sp. BCRC 34962]|nr:Antiviral helicase ski2 [Coemansia sp. BCRC 34962]
MSDAILSEIEQEYLQPRSCIANPQLSSAQQAVPLNYRLCDVLSTSRPWLGMALNMVRSPVTGEYCAAKEVELPMETNPMSLLRAAGRPENYALGSSGQVPFQPGGMADATDSCIEYDVAVADGEELCTVPDGFDRGLFEVAKAQVPGMADSFDLAAKYYGAVDAVDGGEQDALASPGAATTDDADGPSAEIDRLVAVGQDKAQGSRATQIEEAVRKEWAHVIDVNAGFSNFHRLVPKLAREFPFELDVFQKRAVFHIERGDSVFVAAHTSAGKTVVAEYAVALSQMHMTKTIYTSPIKALSNQKFNDFTRAFGEDNVGILTGDVKIRPEAPCLIMTTEVLKNMLYRGADVLRDVEFVVFDECHYINDLERGVVWEEVIIMLPRHVSIILLSATVPNTKEFAEWVGRTKKRDIYVINTSRRPVPLEHYLYVGRNQVSDQEMMKIVDKTGEFSSTSWRDAYTAVTKAPAHGSQAGGGSSIGRGRRGGGAAASHTLAKMTTRHTAERQGTTLWVHLAGMLRKQGLLPAVIFTFSRKRCEEYANSLRNLDFLNDSRRSEVHMFVERCLKRLRPDDRTLPQVQVMRALLKRGIGVHHSGQLPIIKEIVELLFSRGLIGCLFATETFAMGVNMPAKCVVFSSIKKHDGRSFRDLLPGEYTQMAGRAGRRGLDDTGVVIINAANEVPDTVTLHTMLLGAATKLQSQFRLTYTMILNLLRAKQLRVEEVIKRSFGESDSQGQAPEQTQRLLKAKAQLDSYPSLGCAICEDDIASYYRVSSSVQRLTARLHLKAAHRSLADAGTARIAQALCSGRLVLVSFYPHTVLGVLVSKLAADGSQFSCIVLNPPASSEEDMLGSVPPYPVTDLPATIASLNRSDLGYVCRAIPTASIMILLDAVVKLGPLSAVKHSLGQRALASVPSSLAIAIRSSLDNLSGRSLDIEYPWHKIRVLEYQELVHERARLTESASGFQCRACPDLADHYLATHHQAALQSELDELTMQLSDQNLNLLPDYKLRLDVLKDMGYVDEMGNVQLKGRVACEMNSADELVLTELILDNTLAQFEPEEIVALLSAFVCTEKNEPTDLMERLPPNLRTGRERVLEAARRVGSIQVAYGLPISVEEYVREFRFGLMEVAYEWARGLSFLNITSLTDTQEGIIVRCIVRIADVLKNVTSAAMLVGDAELKLKLQAAGELIRRDIVFAASLYF